jgi:hypothetical protein
MPRPLMDLTGRRFGRLYVTGVAERNEREHARSWMCVCDCGQVRRVLGTSLRKGLSKSCGCLRRDVGTLRAEQMRAALSRSGSKAQRMERLGVFFARPPAAETTRVDRHGARIVRGRAY